MIFFFYKLYNLYFLRNTLRKISRATTNIDGFATVIVNSIFFSLIIIVVKDDDISNQAQQSAEWKDKRVLM